MLGSWGTKIKDRWILYTIGILCLALLSLQSLNLDNKPDFERSLDAVVTIQQQHSLIGTGFFYSPDSCVITAHHVIEDVPKKDLWIGLRQTMKRFKAGVVYELPYIDAAIICMGGLKDAPSWLTMKTSEDVHPGDTLYAIGHPSGRNKSLKWAITNGILSKYSYIKILHQNSESVKLRWGRRSISINIPSLFWYPQYVMFLNMDILPGSSGGPLLDENGYVVGMMVGYFGTSSMHPVGISRAIPGTDLVRMVLDAKEK